MNWSGEVYQVKVLGDKIAVYGSGGVTILLPYEHTFGRIDLPVPGIWGKDSIGGNDRLHMFIDEGGRAWTLDASLKLNKIDYSEFLSLMSDSTTISYDKVKDDFYISDGTYTYLFSKHGMSRIGQHVSSCDWYSGELICGNTDTLSTTATFVTDTIDFGLRGIKTITALEIGTLDTALQVAIQYRFSGAQAWQISVAKTVNKNGTVFPVVSGVEFRLSLTFPDYTDAEIDYINIRFKNVDKRVIRGMYASNAQTPA